MKNNKNYTKDELNKIQKLELEALKEIIDICEKLSIEYFLVGGSCLGAVRHNGFIPWDDDIDVGMTRENYEKFILNAPIILKKGYFLQTPYNEKVPYTFSKLRIDGTKFVEYSDRNVKMHHGIYVDIFPFDEAPDDEKKNIKQFNKIKRLTKLFALRNQPNRSCERKNIKWKISNILRRFIFIILHLIPYKFLLKKIDKLAKKYNGTGQKMITLFSYSKRLESAISKDELYPLRPHKFENIIVKIPNDYHAYLLRQYGNYMEFPPIKDQVGHKPYYFDLGSKQ